MKKKSESRASKYPLQKKILMELKIAVFIILVSVTNLFATHTYSQVVKVTLDMENKPLEQVMDEIESQSEFYFIFNQKQIDVERLVTIRKEEKLIDEVLNDVFKGTDIHYMVLDRKILLDNEPLDEEMKAISMASDLLQEVIRGTVTDAETGEAMVGVNIQVKGTTIGVITDIAGKYSLQSGVDPNATLVFSFIGYQTLEVPVSGRMIVDVQLQSEVLGLEEVVVIGYGTQKRSSLTSAVSDFKGDELTRSPVSNAPQALQGLAAGVIVMDRGGAPGKSEAIVRVRGVTTLGSGDPPLVIVDGVEQSMQDLNPDDIESLTVLKDAASTAIYGSRAANGVILITTKRAKSDGISVNYDGYFAMQKIAFKPEFMDLESYMRLQNWTHVNAGRDPRFTEEQIQTWLSTDDRITYPLPMPWWEDGVVLSNAPQHNHTLSLSGGSDEFRTQLNINYYNQDGIIGNSNSEKKEIRLNTDYKVSDRIDVSADLNYRIKDWTSPSETSVFWDMYHDSNWGVPKYPDGTYGVGTEAGSPLVDVELGDLYFYKTNQGIITTKGSIKIIEGLKFSTQYSLNLYDYYYKRHRKEYVIYDYFNKENIVKQRRPNRLYEVRNKSFESTWNNLLTYDANFGKHELHALLGHSDISHQSWNLDARRRNFYNNDITSISEGDASTQTNTGGDSEWGLRSFFTRLSYNFGLKYLLEVTARYDGSSRFTGKNKYSFFPSMAVAWVISNEPFWESLKNTVNNIKLRASWGQTGNQAVSLYSYFESLSTDNYSFGGSTVVGYRQSTLANKDISWETTTQFNIGLDAKLWKDKIGVIFDYYVKTTEGILLTIPIPSVIGLNAPPQNAGKLQNKGWEIELNYNNTTPSNLYYSIGLNLADNRNEVLDLAGTGPYRYGSMNAFFTIDQIGYPTRSYLGYETDGLLTAADIDAGYPTHDPGMVEGDTKYVDQNNDGKLDAEDYIVIGSEMPHYSFGITGRSAYKGFDLYMFIQGVGEVNAMPVGALREIGNWDGFTLPFQNDYWTPDNKDAKWPRPCDQTVRNSVSSTLWVLDASYIKLKALQLGYTFPSSISNKLHIQKLRIYLSGTNLLTLSEVVKWGIDPEFPSGRVNYYPQVSMRTIGLNITW